jgi:two-component system, cell cycle sensor histidine kinase and response regulator CckA
MRSRSRNSLPRWLFYFAIAASWLLGAEIVVLTEARRSLPGRLPTFAGWLFVAAVAFSVAGIARLEMSGKHRTRTLLEQLEEALSSITALTETSLNSLELSELLERILERLVTVLRSEIAIIFILSESQRELEAIAARGMDASGLTIDLTGDEGLLDDVFITAASAATTDERALSLLRERTGLPLVSAAACPILVEGRLIGVCATATSLPKRFDERELHLMQLVADRSGLGIERKRLDDAERAARLDVQRSQRYAIVLASASAALSTARDNFQPNLSTLVDIVVPAFSDWCAIDLLDDTGNLRRLAVRHAVDRSNAASEELRRRIPMIDAMTARSVETGAIQLSASFTTPTSLQRDHPPARRVIDPTPWITVPMTIGSGSIGAITFAFDGGEPATNNDMVITAQDLARRSAISIERVLFYREAQEVAEHSTRVAHQLQSLLDASLQLSRLTDDGAVIAAIAECALDICDANGALVVVTPSGQPQLRALAQRDESVRVGNDELTPSAVELPENLHVLSGPTRIGAMLATPIIGVGGDHLGTLSIWHDDAKEFSNEDEMVLTLLAQTSSTTLASVELYRTIQASEARWRTLIETAPIGVMEVDTEGSVRWANRSAQEIFARSTLLIGGDVSSATGERSGVPQLENLWLRASTGAEVRDRELIGVRIGDVTRDLLVSVVPLFSSENQVQGILTLVADISDRRRLEGELQQAQRMEALGQLAGNVAHDFNNLLTLISGYTELMRAQVGSDVRLIDLVGNIQGVTDRAALLTGRLLTISRHQSSHPRTLSPAKALRSMREVLGKILGERVQLAYEFTDEDGHVSIDPGYFDQIILNLAVNARDAMPDGGTFSILLDKERIGPTEAARIGAPRGESIELVVSDTGTGMDAETLARCFEPFFTTKETSKGTGLGLAAVRGVVVESGGTIQVRSVPGIGTSFIIHLPAVAAPIEELPVARGVDKKIGHSHFSILIAEDDDTLRSMIEKVLTLAGYQVTGAPAGDLALELAKSHPGPIDLLITDVTMPGMTGPELAKAVTKLTPDTAVLFISTDPAGVSEADLSGPEKSFMAKPFRPSELVDRVESILGIPDPAIATMTPE